MLLSPGDGSHHMIDMEKKMSSAIFTELLELHTRLGTNIKFKTGEATRGKKEQRQPKEMAVPKRSVVGSRRSSSNREHAI